VNAGMNQLKDVFLGVKPVGDYNKLMNRKCIRLEENITILMMLVEILII
jgi:alanyl-tRNA synthetase